MFQLNTNVISFCWVLHTVIKHISLQVVDLIVYLRALLICIHVQLFQFLNSCLVAPNTDTPQFFSIFFNDGHLEHNF